MATARHFHTRRVALVVSHAPHSFFRNIATGLRACVRACGALRCVACVRARARVCTHTHARIRASPGKSIRAAHTLPFSVGIKTSLSPRLEFLAASVDSVSTLLITHNLPKVCCSYVRSVDVVDRRRNTTEEKRNSLAEQSAPKLWEREAFSFLSGRDLISPRSSVSL